MPSGALVCLNDQGSQLTIACHRVTAVIPLGWFRKEAHAMSGSREAQLDGWGTSREIEREIAALSVTEKAPEQSGKPTRGWSASGLVLLVWGPGAGVVAAGRLWSGRNRPGVASIP